MLVLSLRERLSGAMVLASDDARERHIALDLAVSVGRGPAWATPFIALSGEIAAEPLVRRAEVAGSGSLDSEGSALVYRVRFRGHDGHELSMRLERRLEVANLYTSIAVLRGDIRDGSAVVARCLIRFDARSELGGVMSSLRLTRQVDDPFRSSHPLPKEVP